MASRVPQEIAQAAVEAKELWLDRLTYNLAYRNGPQTPPAGKNRMTVILSEYVDKTPITITDMDKFDRVQGAGEAFLDELVKLIRGTGPTHISESRLEQIALVANISPNQGMEDGIIHLRYDADPSLSALEEGIIRSRLQDALQRANRRNDHFNARIGQARKPDELVRGEISRPSEQTIQGQRRPEPPPTQMDAR